MRRRDFCGGAIAGLLVRNTASAAPPLTLAYNSLSPVAWPIFIAKEGGCYAKYGLTVNPVLGADPTWVAILARGEAIMGVGDLQQVLPTAAQAGALVAIGASQNKSTLRMVARKELMTAADLKGKRIAVGGPGDGIYGFVLSLLKQIGLSSTDVDLISVGPSGSRRAAALAAQRVDAALLTAQISFRMEEAGYRVIAELAQYDGIVTTSGYWARHADLAGQRSILERLIQAQAEAIAGFYADKDAAIRAYMTHDRQASKDDLARSYDLLVRYQMFERIPYVRKDAVAATLDREGANANLDLTRFRAAVDNSLVDRLLADGFFVRLFGTKIEADQRRQSALAYR